MEQWKKHENPPVNTKNQPKSVKTYKNLPVITKNQHTFNFLLSNFYLILSSLYFLLLRKWGKTVSNKQTGRQTIIFCDPPTNRHTLHHNIYISSQIRTSSLSWYRKYHSSFYHNHHWITIIIIISIFSPKKTAFKLLSLFPDHLIHYLCWWLMYAFRLLMYAFRLLMPKRKLVNHNDDQMCCFSWSYHVLPADDQ